MVRTEWNIFHRCALRILLHCAHFSLGVLWRCLFLYFSLCVQYSWDLTSHLLHSREMKQDQAICSHHSCSNSRVLQEGCKGQPGPAGLSGNKFCWLPTPTPPCSRMDSPQLSPASPSPSSSPNLCPSSTPACGGMSSSTLQSF